MGLPAPGRSSNAAARWPRDLPFDPGLEPDTRWLALGQGLPLRFGEPYDHPTGLLGVGPIAEVAYTERNLLGKGQFLRLKLSGSLENAQVDLSFTEPRFLDQNISAGFDLFHKENDFTDESGFSQRKTGGTLRA